jgi:hypothetical protein
MPPPPPFPWWMLRGLGDEPLVIQTFDAPREPEWEILDPMFVLAYLEGWLLIPEGREVLYDIHATLFGPLPALSFGHGEEHLSLRPALRTAFERMDLIVLVERRPPAIPPWREIPPGPKSEPKPQPKKTWIEVQLLDSDDKPIAGEEYRITLPDGTVKTGSLDDKGLVRFDGIDPGVCDVEFPKIDGREWGKQKFKQGTKDKS